MFIKQQNDKVDNEKYFYFLLCSPYFILCPFEGFRLDDFLAILQF